MPEKENRENGQANWQRVADGLLWLGWRKWLLVLVLWALAAAFTWAIYGPFYETLGATDGLAANSVSDIVEADDGALLIATRGGGISRYDGRSWQALTTRDGLADNRVNALARSRDGDLWAGTAAGLSGYDGSQWRSFTTEGGLPDDSVLALAPDSAGDLWVGTGAGVSRFDADAGTFTPVDVGASEAVVRALLVDGSGGVWVGTLASGLYHYEGTTWSPVERGDGQPFNRVEALYQDEQGDVWVGHRGGLSRYDGRSWRSYGSADGLPDDLVLDLTEDRTGALLAGTNDGLARLDGQAWQAVTPGANNVPDSVEALYVAGDGTLWAGGDGLSHLDGDRWQHYRFRAGFVPALIFVLGTLVIPLYLVLALAYMIARTQPRRRTLRLNRTTLLLVPAFLVGVLLHGVVYAMFYPVYLRQGGDEGVFFVLALLGMPLYLLLLLLKTMVDFFGGGRARKEEGLSLAGDAGGSG